MEEYEGEHPSLVGVMFYMLKTQVMKKHPEMRNILRNNGLKVTYAFCNAILYLQVRPLLP